MIGPSKTFSISDAIIIALTPVIFYIFSYSFEKGYCSRFNLPSDLISINISSLLLIGGIMSSILVIFLVLLQALPDRGTRVIFRSLIFPSFTGLFALILYQADTHTLIKIPFYILFAIALWYDLLKPIFKHKGSLIDRLELQADISDARETPRIQRSIIGVKIKQLMDEGIDFRWIFRLYWILYSGLLISYISGYVYAYNQKTFMIVPDKPDILYLRKWGDHLIGMKYESLNNKLDKEIYLMPINNQTTHVFTTMRISNLIINDMNLEAKDHDQLNESAIDTTNKTDTIK